MTQMLKPSPSVIIGRREERTGWERKNERRLEGSRGERSRGGRNEEEKGGRRGKEERKG